MKARKAMLEVLALTDWSDERLAKSDASHLGPNFLERIREIAAKHGAVDLYNRKVI